MFCGWDTFFDTVPDLDMNGKHDFVDFLIFDSILTEEEKENESGDSFDSLDLWDDEDDSDF